MKNHGPLQVIEKSWPGGNDFRERRKFVDRKFAAEFLQIPSSFMRLFESLGPLSYGHGLLAPINGCGWLAAINVHALLAAINSLAGLTSGLFRPTFSRLRLRES